MILSIDIGNSNINIGAYCDGGLLFLTHIVSEAGKTEVEYAVLLHHILHLHRLSEQNLKGAVISSVVPQLSPVLKAAVQLTSPVPVMQIGPGVKTGLNIRIDNPAQLGADSRRLSARLKNIRCRSSSSISARRRKFPSSTAAAALSAVQSCRGCGYRLTL